MDHGDPNQGNRLPHRPRDGSGRFAKTIESTERDVYAARLFSRGWTYEQIAEELGYGDKAHAHRAVKQVLASMRTEAAAEVRASQLALIAELKQHALQVLETDHYAISRGGKIVKDDEGHPLLDDGPRLAAIATLDKLLAREEALVGTAAPKLSKLELSGDGDRAAELADLIARARGESGQPEAQGGAPGA
jgi:hypothetical protein